MTVTWWINGAAVESEAAVVRADDHGFVVGDGAFETMVVRGTKPFAVRRHLERLRFSARGLGLDVPLDDTSLQAAITETVARSGLSEARIRLTVTGGPGSLGSARAAVTPTVAIAVAALSPAQSDAALAVCPWQRNERGALAGLKTTSYADNVIALAWANERGADEAVFANLAGKLCEGTGSNVFVVADGVVRTPPLRSGCLAGVTRALVLELTDAVEDDIPIEQFREATEVFLTSTTRDVQPVARIDGRALPVVSGPATRDAAARFAALQNDQLDP